MLCEERAARLYARAERLVQFVQLVCGLSRQWLADARCVDGELELPEEARRARRGSLRRRSSASAARFAPVGVSMPHESESFTGNPPRPQSERRLAQKPTCDSLPTRRQTKRHRKPDPA